MEKGHLFTKEEILNMLRQTKKGDELYTYKADLTREFEIFTSDSYGDPAYRTTFFSMHGSPSKLNGMIWPLNYGFEMVTSRGRYYFNKYFKKVMRDRLYLNY